MFLLFYVFRQPHSVERIMHSNFEKTSGWQDGSIRFLAQVVLVQVQKMSLLRVHHMLAETTNTSVLNGATHG